MVLMNVKRIAEVYDHDLEANLDWIRQTFNVDDTAIFYEGQDVHAKIIIYPDHDVLAKFRKDPASDIIVFEEYKAQMWSKIGIFSLHHFHFKDNRVIIGMRRKNELRTIYGEPGQGIVEDYQYMED